MAKILCRYQYRSLNGIEWTKWYTHWIYKTKKEAELALTNLKNAPSIDKKLKIEYKIE